MSNSEQGGSVAWWDHTWAAEGAVWARALEGLTAEQAAWSPPNAPGVTDTAGVRRSAWQIVEHMIFWRENMVLRTEGQNAPTREAFAARNFPEIRDRSEGAWADTRRRFDDSHRAVGAAVRGRPEGAGQAMELLPHDAYHIGQVCYLRAMLGLAPLQ